ncbi:hypothetical protein UA75_27890 [Actinoalloteichus sp. GBA129-24]|uniref:Uncharacterized protein n=1 Tax=Actinoalloteichus fjordicus TaxID=1612552 RepID=A0AAC9LH32_9PSEU|nr:hypothetical protein UA74_27345 [Actinoalloteichus fjordicus]APU23549.1 hypothetical protein UA75_27890 [Actinoalloteichus sp. GBA129-24]
MSYEVGKRGRELTPGGPPRALVVVEHLDETVSLATTNAELIQDGQDFTSWRGALAGLPPAERSGVNPDCIGELLSGEPCRIPS